MAGNEVLRATLANHLLEVANSITFMCASAPRTEARSVGVKPWMCGDWASSNERRTTGEGKGVASDTHGPFSPLRIVHRNELTAIQISGRIGLGELHRPLVNLLTPSDVQLIGPSIGDQSPRRGRCSLQGRVWEHTSSGPVNRRRIQISIRSVNLGDYYTIPHQLYRNQAESGLVVSRVLRDISLQERQVCVRIGRLGSNMTSINGGGGRSGNRSRHGGREGERRTLLRNRHGH